jgi:hypothetical protein
MNVGLYHPTQRTHIQLSIRSKVSVVDIYVSPVMVGILKKISHTEYIHNEIHSQVDERIYDITYHISSSPYYSEDIHTKLENYPTSGVTQRSHDLGIT